MQSIFLDKNSTPTLPDLKRGLKTTYSIWKTIEDFTLKNYPGAVGEWSFSSEKFGWSYRIKDKKRVLVYLLPRDGFFKAAFVFGQKALDQIYSSDVSKSIKTELETAKKNAEGKGIRIEVKDKNILEDIKRLILIKIGN